jgi:hypothetical protein
VIFAREISDGLTSLVKKIDEANASNQGMGSFVVFLGDEEGMEQKLKDLADKEQIKTTILTLDNPAGPRGYNVARDADVTVVYYVQKKVKANHAFKKGELKDVDTVVKDLDKILPKK